MKKQINLFLLVLVLLSLPVVLADNWFGSIELKGSVAENNTPVSCFYFSNNSKIGDAVYYNSNNPPYAIPGYWMTLSPSLTGKIYFKVDGLVVDQSEEQIGVNNGISCSICSGTTHLLNLTVTDEDGDNYVKAFTNYQGSDKDCDDTRADVYPGAPEIYDDGIDNNCNGETDEGTSGSVDDVSGNVEGLTLEINDSSGIGNVVFKDGDGNPVLEFDYDFDAGTLDLSAINIILDPNAGEGGIIIQGLDLTSQGLTKTVYFNKTSSTNTLCIIDDEVASITVTDDCANANGIKVTCDGTNLGYSCATIGGKYRVSGLSHSAVTQYSYTAPAATTTSGGGGGGGGCSTIWTCTAWSTCSAAGDQTRTCSYPANFCVPTATKPAEIQTCTYVAPIVLNTPTETTTPEEQTTTPTGGAGITGGVIGTLTSPTGIGIIIVIAAVLIGGIILVSRAGKGKKAKKKTAEKED